MNVLAISNSFGVDAHTYLHQIARAAGDAITVVTLYIGGCPLDRHYRNMLGNQRNYELYFNGYATGFRVSIEDALLSRSWDVVTLQQVSGQSTKPETYQPYAFELASYVRRYAPKAKLLLHQTWAYEQGSEKLCEKMGYARTEDMFRDIEKAYAQCAEELQVDGIIPSGKLFMDLLANGIEKVQRDTYHASLGLGRYALGLLWYRMLTGKSVADNTFCDFNAPVTDEEVRIAKKCVDAFEVF